MSQFFIQGTGGGGGGGPINTLSAEGGAPQNPSGNNFNFSGSIAGGSPTNGAITFGPAAPGEIPAVVNVDGSTIEINAANQLQVLNSSTWHVANIDFTAVPGNSYAIVGAGPPINVTVPEPVADWSTFTVYDASGRTFKLVQLASEQIQLGQQLTTVGVAGSITSELVGDFITLVALPGGLDWISIPYNGNFLVV